MRDKKLSEIGREITALESTEEGLRITIKDLGDDGAYIIISDSERRELVRSVWETARSEWAEYHSIDVEEFIEREGL